MSWKKQGGSGIDKQNTNNNMSVNVLIADTTRVRKSTADNVDISGSIFVGGQTTLNGGVQVGNTQNKANAIISGNLTVGLNAPNVFISNGNIIANEIKVNNNLSVSSNFNLGTGGGFITGNLYNIGINKSLPNSTLDIYGTNSQSLNIYSTQPNNTNTIAQNGTNKGIKIFTDNSNSGIFFNNDVSMNNNNNPDCSIKYSSGGKLYIDVSQNIGLLSNVIITNRNKYLLAENPISSHINNETVIIYDTSNGLYNPIPNIYGNINGNKYNTGNALSLISMDNSSNTFLNINTPSKLGISVGGGSYPYDNTRSMGIIGIKDKNGNIIQNQVILSGNNFTKNPSTIGFNTFKPITEKYIIDINGPMHISNGQITQVYTITETTGTIGVISRFSNGKAYAGGKHTSINCVLYTMDNGLNWYNSSITDEQAGNITKLADVFNIPNSNSSIYLFNKLIYYSINNGLTLQRIISSFVGGIEPPYSNLYICKTDDFYRCIITDNSSGKNNYFDISYNSSTKDISYNSSTLLKNILFTDISYNVNCLDGINGSNTNVFFAGFSIIRNYDIINMIRITSDYKSLNNINYTSISAYTETIISTGYDDLSNNWISYSKNKGLYWTDLSFNINTIITKVLCIDNSNSIIVGYYNDTSGGFIKYSINGGNNWNDVPYNLLNTNGNADEILKYKLSWISLIDINTFAIIAIKPPDNIIFNCHLPNLFNNSNNSVFDVSGSIVISGDININDGGSFNSNNSTVSLLNNTNIQTINLGLNTKDTINIGSSLGITNINNGALRVIGNVNKPINEIDPSNNICIDGDLWVSGAIFNVAFPEVNKPLKLYDVTIKKGLTIEGFGNPEYVFISFEVSKFLNLENSTSTATGGVVISGGVGIVKDVCIGGNINIANNINIKGNIDISNNLTIYGAFNQYGITNNYNDTNSTSISTGSLVVNGGIGIAKDICIGGNIYFNKTIPVSIVESSGNLIIDASSVYLTGNTLITSNPNNTNIVPVCELHIEGNLWASTTISTPTVNTVTSYTTSDYRIKNNIKPLDETTNIDKLNPVQYHNILMDQPDYGFIAHELQEVYPELVKGIKDGVTNQSINYTGLIGIIISEMQFMKARIVKLEEELRIIKS